MVILVYRFALIINMQMLLHLHIIKYITRFIVEIQNVQ